jgi:pyruvate/2-oxoglutarate dehydrogenase complex dihydrolipoamide dehydrogenase (E3) component
MNTEKTFDYLVIGAGSGGLLAYVGLKNLGKNVAIVSKNIGGDCTQYGCVPSKTFLHLAKEYRLTIDPAKKAKIKDESLNSIRKMVQGFTHEETKLVLVNHILMALLICLGM